MNFLSLLLMLCLISCASEQIVSKRQVATSDSPLIKCTDVELDGTYEVVESFGNKRNRELFTYILDFSPENLPLNFEKKKLGVTTQTYKVNISNVSGSSLKTINSLYRRYKVRYASLEEATSTGRCGVKWYFDPTDTYINDYYHSLFYELDGNNGFSLAGSSFRKDFRRLSIFKRKI